MSPDDYIKIIGGIVGLVTGVLTLIRTLRERGVQVSGSLPIAQLHLAVSSYQQELPLRKWKIWQVLTYVAQGTIILAFILLFLVIRSPLAAPSPLVIKLFTNPQAFPEAVQAQTGGSVEGDVVILLLLLGYLLLILYVYYYYTAAAQLLLWFPSEGPSNKCSQTEVSLNSSRSCSMLALCAKVLQEMKSKITDIDLKEYYIKAKKGDPLSGYDEITVRITPGEDECCLLKITSDGIRPTFTPNKRRNFNHIRKFLNLIIS